MKNITGRISIIMPAYNEVERISVSIAETIETFEKSGCSYEIIVIDDGSTDDTYKTALKAAGNHPNVHVKRDVMNSGKGSALKKAFGYATGNFIVFLDADLDLHPRQVQILFDVMHERNADIVIGSKRHPKSTIYYPWHRRVVSLVYFFLVKVLFGLPVRDTQTGLKLFKREVLAKTFPKVLIKKFAYDLELLVVAHHNGYKIAEAPVVVESTCFLGCVALQSIWDTWMDTMAVFYRMHILRYYDNV